MFMDIQPGYLDFVGQQGIMHIIQNTYLDHNPGHSPYTGYDKTVYPYVKM